jgi:hypothetical protein
MDGSGQQGLNNGDKMDFGTISSGSNGYVFCWCDRQGRYAPLRASICS